MVLPAAFSEIELPFSGNPVSCLRADVGFPEGESAQPPSTSTAYFLQQSSADPAAESKGSPMSEREPDVADWPGFHGRIIYDDALDSDVPLSEDEAALMRDLGATGTTRRDFMKILAMAGLSISAAQLLVGCRSNVDNRGDNGSGLQA